MADFYEVTKLFFIYVGWWLIPLTIIFLYRRSLNKYPVEVTIYEKRGENLVWTQDVAGRFENPVVCYKLKKNKDSIPIPHYDWILQAMTEPRNLLEKISDFLSGKIGQITLFKYGSKQYKPVKVKLATGEIKKEWKEITNSKGEPVMIQVYEYINPKQAMGMVRLEIIDWDDINHMTQELRAIAVRRSPILSALEKYAPIIGITLAVLALIIAGYYFKEMMIDAGDKLISSAKLASNQGGQAISPPNPNPNIPVIGELVNPS